MPDIGFGSTVDHGVRLPSMGPGSANADSATSPHRPASIRCSCQHRLSTALPLDLRTVPVEGAVHTLAGCDLKGGAAVSNPNRQGGTSRSPVPGVITFTATQDGPRQFGTRGCRFMYSINQPSVPVPPQRGTIVLLPVVQRRANPLPQGAESPATTGKHPERSPAAHRWFSTPPRVCSARTQQPRRARQQQRTDHDA